MVTASVRIVGRSINWDDEAILPLALMHYAFSQLAEADI